MRYYPLLIIGLLWGVLPMSAQNPKWTQKAQKAVFSIITYGQDGRIRNTGNGFFVSNDGIALSDYRLFEGAEKAVIVTSDGKQMDVSSILGANDMYDVVRFRVDVPKKVNSLQLAEAPAQTGHTVYLLPYSTRKNKTVEKGNVNAVTKIEGNHSYYTLNMPLQSKMISCPILNEDGQVLGLLQKSSGNDTVRICYAIDATYAASRTINALSGSDPVLNKIGIRKALPELENDALVYLFMAQSQISKDKYKALLDEFVRNFPESSEGYLRRAAAVMDNASEAGEEEQKMAESDFEQAVKVSEKKDDVYYMIARTIYGFLLASPDNKSVSWSLDDALMYIQKAQEINPLPTYVQLQGDILFAQKKFPEALSCYQRVNDSELASPATYYSAAKTAQLCGKDIPEILVLMDSCVARCSKPLTTEEAAYVLERADFNMQAEKYRQAWMDYNAYFEAVNGQVNDVFHYMRSLAAIKSRQYQGALDDLQRAIQLNPAELTYKAELAGLNLLVGQTESALAQLNELIETAPDYAEAYRLKGLCLIQLQKKAEACACFEQAIRLGDKLTAPLQEKYCQ